MNNWFKIIIYTALLFSFTIKAQERKDKKEIFSGILNEKREVWIHLPKSYHDSMISPAKYPVIYLLDAEINFDYYAPLTDFLAKPPYAEIPECIVVGIKNTDRTRDLTPTKSFKKNPVNPNQVMFENSGGSEKFVQFIQQELKPFINKNYRTENYTVLVGHSFGGLFTVNTLLNHPDYFNVYVAHDPSLWWDNKTLVTSTKNYLEKNKKFPPYHYLYVSQANNEGQNKNWNSDMMTAIQEFRNLLEKGSGLQYKHHYFEDEVHGTVSYPGNYDALRFIFKGFRTDIKQFSKNPELLEKSYRKFSDNKGAVFNPSEGYLNFIIDFMKKNEFKDSETYFKKLRNKLYGK